LLGRLVARLRYFRDEYCEWARQSTYRRGMALAGPNVLTYPQYRDVYDRLAARWNVGSRLRNPPSDKATPPDAFVVDEHAFREMVWAMTRLIARREDSGGSSLGVAKSNARSASAYARSVAPRSAVIN
jgi:hypothetical protein